MSNVQDARREMTKTKEQLEEEKKISLSIRIKPLELDSKFFCNILLNVYSNPKYKNRAFLVNILDEVVN